MALSISRGRKPTPVRAVIYGMEGIGKTTLASQFPDAIVIDTEEGSLQLDCSRIEVADYLQTEAAIHDLVRDNHGFKSVVVDSMDWLERQVVEMILRKNNKRSIEDFGFGKGFVMLAEQIAKFLQLCDHLVDVGLNVCLVAHSQVKRTSPPDETDGFDRYELKLTKHSAPLVKEWADIVLFAAFQRTLVEGSDGRMKARGGKNRVLHTVHSAAWDAKNRFGLADTIPMEISALQQIFPSEPVRKSPTRVAAEGKAKTIIKVIETATTIADLQRFEKRAAEVAQNGEITAEEYSEIVKLVKERKDGLA